MGEVFNHMPNGEGEPGLLYYHPFCGGDITPFSSLGEDRDIISPEPRVCHSQATRGGLKTFSYVGRLDYIHFVGLGYRH